MKFPQYQGSLAHTHLFPEDVVPDTLHAKIHFGEFDFGITVAPLVEVLEDRMEGYSLHQSVSGLGNTGLGHKGAILLEEMKKNQKPISRKNLLVEGVKTSFYENFINKRTKSDLVQRLEMILKKNSDLRRVNGSVSIPQNIIVECQLLLNGSPKVKNIQDFLVQIVRNRSQEGFAAAFMGKVMTMEETSQCNTMRALKDAVKKLAPGSVEHAP